MLTELKTFLLKHKKVVIILRSVHTLQMGTRRRTDDDDNDHDSRVDDEAGQVSMQ